MGLFDKVRILVSALVHKPFAPGPDREEVSKEPATGETMPRDSSSPAREKDLVEDTGRVADLISQRSQDEAG
jgi:hypothetical protein